MKELSNKQTRNKIMLAIAEDSLLSKEMTGAMMNSKNGMMMHNMTDNNMMNNKERIENNYLIK